MTIKEYKQCKEWALTEFGYEYARAREKGADLYPPEMDKEKWEECFAYFCKHEEVVDSEQLSYG